MEDSRLCEIFRKIHDLEAAVELRSSRYQDGQQEIKKSRSEMSELSEELHQVKHHISLKEDQLAGIKQELTWATVQLKALSKCAAEVDDKVLKFESQTTTSSSQMDALEDVVVAETDLALANWFSRTAGHTGMVDALRKINDVAASIQPFDVQKVQAIVDGKNRDLDNALESVAVDRLLGFHVFVPKLLDFKLCLREAADEITTLERERDFLESER